MMGEIVYHGHSAFDRADLHSAFDRFESIERFLDLFLAYAPCICGDDHCQTISNVELTYQLRLELTPIMAALKNSEPRCISGKINVTGLPLCVVARSERFDGG